MTENSNREEKQRRRERENKREAVGRRKGEVGDVTPGNEDRRSERKAEERGGWGQEVFNYSARRQQRPRFQETITVGSLWGEAHLASFIPPILVSLHKLQVGIFNVFFCCTKQTHARAQTRADALNASYLGAHSLLPNVPRISKCGGLIETVQIGAGGSDCGDSPGF